MSGKKQEAAGQGGSAGKQPAKAQSSFNLASMAPLIIFLLVIAVGAGLYLNNQHQAHQHVKAVREQNKKLKLPDDYPLELVPLIEGAEVVEATKGDAKSDTGEDMDKWVVKAHVNMTPKQINDYYFNDILKKGLRQTMYITVPDSYDVHYGDETHIVEFAIDKLPENKYTILTITVHQVRGK